MRQIQMIGVKVMLNRNSKRFLSFLRRSTPDYDNRVISYEFIEENYDCSIQSVFATVRYLEKLGYIEIAKMNGHSFGVILTELALHPYEFSIAEIKDFLFRSVFTPVAVSIATTLITLWLKSLL